MSESFSQCVLLGALRQSVKVEATPNGTSVGVFDLILREQTAAGTWYTIVAPCQLWGKHLDAARSLRPGQTCLFQGKLARRKRGEQWKMCVSGWTLEPFALPPPVPDAAMSRN